MSDIDWLLAMSKPDATRSVVPAGRSHRLHANPQRAARAPGLTPEGGIRGSRDGGNRGPIPAVERPIGTRGGRRRPNPPNRSARPPTCASGSPHQGGDRAHHPAKQRSATSTRRGRSGQAAAEELVHVPVGADNDSSIDRTFEGDNPVRLEECHDFTDCGPRLMKSGFVRNGRIVSVRRLGRRQVLLERLNATTINET